MPGKKASQPARQVGDDLKRRPKSGFVFRARERKGKEAVGGSDPRKASQARTGDGWHERGTGGAISRPPLSTLPAGDLLSPTADASPSGSGGRWLRLGCGEAGGRGGEGGGGVASAGSRDNRCRGCRSRYSATTGGHRSLRHYCLPHTATAPPELPGTHPSGWLHGAGQSSRGGVQKGQEAGLAFPFGGGGK